MNLALAPVGEKHAVEASAKAHRDAYVRCAARMHERLSDPELVAQDVALAAAVSLRTLHRAFAAEGRTFAGVLRELRLSGAQRLLSDRQFHRLNLVEVARRCGYADGSHFARQFRQALGTTPAHFALRRNCEPLGSPIKKPRWSRAFRV